MEKNRPIWDRLTELWSKADFAATRKRIVGGIGARRLEGALFGETFSRESCVHFMADHLEGALAMVSELSYRASQTPDLEDASAELGTGQPIAARIEVVRSYADELQALELGILAKLRQARVWTERIERYDPKLRQVAGMFLFGTHAVMDVASEIQNGVRADFDGPHSLLEFLRTRGLADPGVQTLEDLVVLTPRDDFAFLGGVPLSALVGQIESFLDSADTHYALYEPRAGDGAAVDETNAVETEADEHAAGSETADPIADGARTGDEDVARGEGETKLDVAEPEGGTCDEIDAPVAVMKTLVGAGVGAEAGSADKAVHDDA